MKRYRQLFVSILLTLVLVALPALPVLADTFVSYYPITITDTGGANRVSVPVLLGTTGQDLIDNGLSTAAGTNTRMRTSAANLPYITSTTKLGTIIADLPANGNASARLYCGYTPAFTDFDIITGHGGYITRADDADMELDDDFEIEIQDTYINTALGTNKNLTTKGYAFKLLTGEVAEEVTARIGYAGNFANIDAEIGNVDLTDDTTVAITLPAGIVAGDLLLAFCNSDSDASNVTHTYPAGWTELAERMAAQQTSSIGYRIADGGEGASFNLTQNIAEECAWVTYRISGYTGVPEVSAANVAANANPNSLSLTPTWEARNTLWFSTAGWDLNRVVTDYPAGYAGGRDEVANDCGIGSCYIEVNAAAEDPGTYTISAADGWSAYTVAVGGAPFEVTATGILSNEHDITTSMDWPFFGIDVDGNALLPVGDNAGDLVFNTPLWQDECNADPFTSIDSYAHSCDVTDAVWGANGYVFDRDDDRITLPQAVSQSLIGAAGVTLMVWVNQSVLDATTQAYFMIYNAANLSRVALQCQATTGILIATVRSNVEAAQTANGSALAPAGWHFVAVVTNLPAQTVSVWYDSTEVPTGGLAFSDATFANSVAGATNDKIGITRTLTNDFGGTIGDAKLYNRVLTDAEVLQNYNATKWKYEADTDRQVKSTLATVPDIDTSGWVIMDNSTTQFMPYMNSYQHTVNDILIAHYEPSTMLAAAILADEEGGNEPATINWGTNSNITLTYGEIVSGTPTSSSTGEEGGYDVPESDMPTEWYGTASNITNLPLYSMYNGIATSTGIPCKTLYVFTVLGMCFAFATAGYLMFESVTAGVVGITVALAIGCSMTVVPVWLAFLFGIMAIGLMWLKGRSGL